MTNHEGSLPPGITAILDELLADWSTVQQLSGDELELMSSEILSDAELPLDWWDRHMSFFNSLMKRVDRVHESATQALGQVSVQVQGVASPISTFSGGSDWQPYLKLA